MAIEQHNLFPAIEFPLTHYNGKSINNEQFIFYNEDGETAFAFPNVAELYLQIYEEREGRLLKTFTTANGLSRSDNVVTWNAASLTMEFSHTKGPYWYELYYVTSGGYDFALMYGALTVI